MKSRSLLTAKGKLEMMARHAYEEARYKHGVEESLVVAQAYLSSCGFHHVDVRSLLGFPSKDAQ